MVSTFNIVEVEEYDAGTTVVPPSSDIDPGSPEYTSNCVGPTEEVYGLAAYILVGAL